MSLQQFDIAESLAEGLDLVWGCLRELQKVLNESTGELDWTKIKPSTGVVKLVAATVIRPDFDTVNFQTDQTDIPNLEVLVRLHHAAVDSAKSSRLALLRAFEGLIKGV